MPSTQRDSLPLAFSLQLYRLLLLAYPSGFRLEYGELMTQAFRDSCRRLDISLARLWGRTLLDFLLSVIEEHTHRGAEMTNSRWIKLSGWSLAASGLVLFLAMLAGSRPEYSIYNAASLAVDRLANQATTPLMLVGFVLLGLGLFGLRARFAQAASGLGRTGLAMSLLGLLTGLVGLIGSLISESGPWWETMLTGMVVMLLGLTLFGIDSLRLRLFTRWNVLPIIAGLPFPVLALIDFFVFQRMETAIPFPEWAQVALFALTFAGLILIGYRLQADTPEGGMALAA